MAVSKTTTVVAPKSKSKPLAKLGRNPFQGVDSLAREPRAQLNRKIRTLKSAPVAQLAPGKKPAAKLVSPPHASAQTEMNSKKSATSENTMIDNFAEFVGNLSRAFYFSYAVITQFLR